MGAPRPTRVSASTLVGDLMTDHTAAIAVFIRHKMMCVGCPVAHLHDIAEVCGEYGIPVADFLAEIEQVIGSGLVGDD